MRMGWRTNLRFSHEREPVGRTSSLIFYFGEPDRFVLLFFNFGEPELHPVLDGLRFRVPKQPPSLKEAKVLFRVRYKEVV